ncbi:MAG: amino acid carrier protein [Oscillospiraceae bacterium]|nr:amino acid carrier protein [Oscillospiraceae bacterium]
MNEIVWGPPTVIFILLVGVFFTVRLRFFQILNIKLWLRDTFGTLIGNNSSKNCDKNSISPFQAIATSIGGCVGTGNIIGIAGAVITGGPGALFWMWVACFFSMMTAFAENVLSIKFRRKDEKGRYYGGPMVYMEDGLKKKQLGLVFSVICALGSLINGGFIQTNAMCVNIKNSFNISGWATALITTILVAIIIFGGTKRIVSVTEKIVPFMAITYLAIGLIIFAANFSKLGSVIASIIKEAFNFKSISTGGVGSVALIAMNRGTLRGLFSSEAGLGTAPIIHSTSSNEDPVKQGAWGIFQVFISGFIVCSVTGFSILLTGVNDVCKDSGIITAMAFDKFIPFGKFFLCVILILFAFSTIMGCAFQGEKVTQYIFKTKRKKSATIYKIFTLISILLSAFINVEAAWGICDLSNLFMMITNLMALLMLSKTVVFCTRSYLKKEQEKSIV